MRAISNPQRKAASFAMLVFITLIAGCTFGGDPVPNPPAGLAASEQIRYGARVFVPSDLPPNCSPLSGVSVTWTGEPTSDLGEPVSHTTGFGQSFAPSFTDSAVPVEESSGGCIYASGLASIEPGTYEFRAELNFDGEAVQSSACEELILDSVNLSDGDSSPNWVGFTFGVDGCFFEPDNDAESGPFPSIE